MALPSLVDVDQFSDWIGEDVDNIPQVEAWLRTASGLVRHAAGVTWTTVDEDEVINLDDVPDEIEGVVCQAVERKHRNPAGVVQDTVGPLTQRHADRAAEGIYLTDAEKATCSRYATTGGLSVIEVTRGDPMLQYTPLTVPFENGSRFPWFDVGELGVE